MIIPLPKVQCFLLIACLGSAQGISATLNQRAIASIHHVEAFCPRVTPKRSELLLAPHVSEFMLPCALRSHLSLRIVSRWAGSMHELVRPLQSSPRDCAARPDIFSGACWEVATSYGRAARSCQTPLGSMHRARSEEHTS